MPLDYSRYPANWLTEIRPGILRRSARWCNHAGEMVSCCEWCGAKNGAHVFRWPDGHWEHADEFETSRERTLYQARDVFIVLTIAHLGTEHPDGTPGDKHDKMDCRPENLAALCQRCHLLYDLDDHVRHAAETRRRKRIEAGQLELAVS